MTTRLSVYHQKMDYLDFLAAIKTVYEPTLMKIKDQLILIGNKRFKKRPMKMLRKILVRNMVVTNTRNVVDILKKEETKYEETQRVPGEEEFKKILQEVEDGWRGIQFMMSVTISDFKKRKS